jgi:transcription antitermination factor NusG
MNRAEQQWKVIYTASRQEKKVADMLTKFGIEHYLPMVKKLRLWSDRKKWVEVPLFNGYVFVKPTEFQRDKVLETPGVVKYLRYNGEDALLRDVEIDFIMRIIQNGYDVEVSEMQFNKGQLVTITAGPLKGIEAEILRVDGNSNEILIGFETISQTLRVTLPSGILKKKSA